MDNLEDFLYAFEDLPEAMRAFLAGMEQRDISINDGTAEFGEQAESFFGKLDGNQEASPEVNTEHEEEIGRRYGEIGRLYGEILVLANEQVNSATVMLRRITKSMKYLTSQVKKEKTEFEARNKGITEKVEKKIKDMDIGTPGTSNSAASGLLSVGPSGAGMKNQKKNKVKKGLKIETAGTSANSSVGPFVVPSVNAPVGSGKNPTKKKGASKKVDTPGECDSNLSFYNKFMEERRQIMKNYSSKPQNPTPKGIILVERPKPGLREPSAILGTKATAAAQHQMPVSQTSTSNFGGIIRDKREKNGSSSANYQLAPIPVPIRVAEVQAAGSSTGARKEFSSVYCHCRQPRTDDMIVCGNKQCPIKLFHCSCIGTTAGRKQWYCDLCKNLCKTSHKKKGHGRKKH